MLNHVAQTTGIERDDRSLAKQRLDRDETESLVDRWDDHGSGALVQGRQLGLGDLAMPADTCRHPELFRQLLERSAAWSVTDNVQRRLRLHRARVRGAGARRPSAA